MFRTASWLTAWFFFALAANVTAAAPTFKDRAHLFSAEAVDEAKGLIAELREQYHTDVAVESYKAVPFHKDAWGKVKKMSPAEQDRFVLEWAKERLPGPNAVCILIVHGPAFKNVQVAAGRKLLANHGFTAENVRAVRERIQAELNAGHADAGLTAGLRLAHVFLHENLGEGGSVEPLDWQAYLAVGLFGVAVIGVVIYMRRPARRSSTHGIVDGMSQLLRSPTKPVAPPVDLVKPTHQPLKDWW